MAVGIYLRVDHVGLFNAFFNSSRTLTDRNVVQFEPMRSDNCKPQALIPSSPSLPHS